MIEDLIEGISCYCDNNYQLQALNNMYSELLVGQRSFDEFAKYDDYDGDTMSKVGGYITGSGPGPSKSEIARRKLSLLGNNVDDRINKKAGLFKSSKPNKHNAYVKSLQDANEASTKSLGFMADRLHESERARELAERNFKQERYDRGIDNARRDAQLHGIENERNAYKKGADKAFEAAHKYKDSLHKWKVGTGIAAGTAALGLGAYALYKHHKAKKEAEKAALEAQYA
jgi:hypothetical protein